ncbi:MAG: hypothetical protein ACRERW_02885 [Pseudomonas sp.]
MLLSPDREQQVEKRATWLDGLRDKYLEKRRLDDLRAEMSSIHIQRGQTLSLVIDNVQSFKHRCPEQFEALVECAAFVNWRVVTGGTPLLALAFTV